MKTSQCKEKITRNASDCTVCDDDRKAETFCRPLIVHLYIDCIDGKQNNKTPDNVLRSKIFLKKR
jgi:hypothetical protein